MRPAAFAPLAACTTHRKTQIAERATFVAISRVYAMPELSTGPFCVTQSNPTHQLTDPTRPNPLQVEKLGPNPTQRNTTNKELTTFSSDVFLYTELIGFQYRSDRP